MTDKIIPSKLMASNGAISENVNFDYFINLSSSSYDSKNLHESVEYIRKEQSRFEKIIQESISQVTNFINEQPLLITILGWLEGKESKKKDHWALKTLIDKNLLKIKDKDGK